MENKIKIELQSEYSEYDIELMIKVINRICNRIETFEFYDDGYYSESWGSITCASRGYYLTQGIPDDGYLMDTYFIVKRVCAAVYDLFGNWESVADVIKEDLDRYNSKVKFYRLKPEYAEMVKDACKNARIELENQKAEINKKQEEKKAYIESVKNSIKEMKTTKEVTKDKNNDSSEYLHEITLHNGNKLLFRERYIPDFGRVVNPCYSVKEGLEPGGLVTKENGISMWEKTGEGIIRPLTDDENIAFNAVHVLGCFK